jgi:hypothetical protein
MLSVFRSVVTFSNELSIITISVVAAIFTFGFVQGLKRTIFTPVIMAYLVPPQTNSSKMIKSLRNNQFIYIGEFIAELIQWLVFMLVCYLIWLARSRW